MLTSLETQLTDWLSISEDRQHAVTAAEREPRAGRGGLEGRDKCLDGDHAQNSAPCEQTEGSGFVCFLLTVLRPVIQVETMSFLLPAQV